MERNLTLEDIEIPFTNLLKKSQRDEKSRLILAKIWSLVLFSAIFSTILIGTILFFIQGYSFPTTLFVMCVLAIFYLIIESTLEGKNLQIPINEGRVSLKRLNQTIRISLYCKIIFVAITLTCSIVTLIIDFGSLSTWQVVVIYVLTLTIPIIIIILSGMNSYVYNPSGLFLIDLQYDYSKFLEKNLSKSFDLVNHITRLLTRENLRIEKEEEFRKDLTKKIQLSYEKINTSPNQMKSFVKRIFSIPAQDFSFQPILRIIRAELSHNINTQQFNVKQKMAFYLKQNIRPIFSIIGSSSVIGVIQWLFENGVLKI